VPTDHSLWLGVVCTTVCDSVCQWFVGGRSSSFFHQQDKPPWTWWYNWNIVQCCFALTIHNPNTELLMLKGLSWSWSHGSWIYNYLCNKCLSPRTLWAESRSGEVYSIQHYVSQLLAAGLWFFPCTSVSSTNKYERHDKSILEHRVKHHNPNLSCQFKHILRSSNKNKWWR
jgi:hypothetical protein